MSPIVVAIIAIVAFAGLIAFVLFIRKRPDPSLPAAVPPTQRSKTDHDTSVEDVPARPSAVPLPDDELDAQFDDEVEDDGAVEIRVTGIGLTDVGLRRKLNEDAFVLLPDHDLYALADGMGAHAAGEVASKLTLEAISDAFERNKFADPESPDRPSSRRRRLTRVIERANQIVHAMSEEVEGYRGMGTTVVMVNFSANKRLVFIAHAGDSRCYRVRGDEITQLTVDHTLGNVGIMGKTSSLLSRAVGIELHIDPEVNVNRTEVGDIYLLCSDGLSRMISDEAIHATIRAEQDLSKVAKDLIAKAKAAGGRDNVTTVLMRLDAAPHSAENEASGDPL